MQYYSISDIDKILKNFNEDNVKVTKSKGVYYYEIASSFDIEVSSFYVKDKKQATMYVWTFGIEDYIIIGRTWEDFNILYYKLVEHFSTSDECRLIVYVHNLSYEFQFIKNRFEWLKVFALKQREPVQAITNEGIEFRCSYLLSGYSLENLSSQLTKYKVDKKVGDLDYNLIRHSYTPLTEKELGYCISDVLVVIAYIRETIEREKSITNIPLTKTGYVRNYCRKECLYTNDNKYHDKFKKYRNFIKELKLDVTTYKQLKKAFAGGFTHANAFYSGELLHNVASFDFTSSYPYVMVSEKFPMSQAELVNIHDMKELKYNLSNYCCMFELELFDTYSIFEYENYISVSHCRELEQCTDNNGRVVKAKHLVTTVTEQDYAIIKKLYKWKGSKIYNFRRFKKDYLPKDFILSILKLYNDKTTLKDVVGKEIDYMQSKEKINACYGMSVTDICKDEILYKDNEWTTEEVDYEESIKKYNKSVKRFLYYPWGIWVTAYARKNLFTAIYEFNSDYIYSDTDSVKVLNYQNHMDYINNYNKSVIKKLKIMCEHYNIDIAMTKPKNIKGKEKQLGIWNFEGIYDKFKTIGAKRYLIEKDGDLEITVSGLNKKKAIEYLKNKYKDKIFDKFDDGLYIPPIGTGKLTHTYIDNEISGYIKDYTGVSAYYNEYSCVHMEGCDYDMSISETYVNYLLGIQTKLK